jgi:thiosulfate/3-mercaptopyruvate sulfurtransferase
MHAADSLRARTISRASRVSRKRSPSLVTTERLADALGKPGLCVVDASWHMPNAGRDAQREFRERHIPAAVFFDIDRIADKASVLPHMLPTPDVFAQAVGALGISNSDRIIIYDSHGLMSAPRVWWTFRAFGHADVAVLDGGLPKWLQEGRPVERGTTGSRRPSRYVARFRPALVRDKAQLIANLETEREQVLDARSQGRFFARDPEPRPGLRGGHIPRSLNLPFERLIDSDHRTVLPIDKLRNIFEGAGIRLDHPIVTTCGSGITACTLAFGLHLVGAKTVAVYDGAWAEWGGSNDTPVETL